MMILFLLFSRVRLLQRQGLKLAIQTTANGACGAMARLLLDLAALPDLCRQERHFIVGLATARCVLTMYFILHQF